MSSFGNEVFISYAWGGESERIVNEIANTLQEKGIKLIRDKSNLGYKGSIKEFMERIGRGNCVIVVISDKYLRSENCMFELVQIAGNQNFYDRVFPIILQDANIHKAVNRIEYIRYWEDEVAELDSAIKTVNTANLQGITDDIDLYAQIRATISRLTNILKDMNALSPEIHENSNFDQLIEALEKRIKAPSRKISLQTWNGQYIRAEGGGGGEVLANGGEIDEWTMFDLIELEDNKIGLRAHNGDFVCAEGGGGREVVASRKILSGWESFELVKQGDDKVALRVDIGQYMSVEDDGVIVAKRNVPHEKATFRLIHHSKV